MTDVSTLGPLRDTVQSVCAARGLTYEPYSHDAYRIDDAICGLANLASGVAHVDEADWPEEVHQWLAGLDRIRKVRASEVTEANIYPRLTRNAVPDASDPAYPVTGLVPGLSLIFAADYPTHVSGLPASALFTHVGELEEVGRISINNLHRLPVPDPDLVDLEIDGSDRPVVAFEFDDFFAPSRLLYASTFAAEHLTPSDHGFLAAAPTRDVLLFLPVDADNILNQVNVFASTVDNLYRSGPGSACEITYHLSPAGDLDAVASLTAENSLYFRPNEYLASKFFHSDKSEA
ncbi:hypothetical protein FK529_16215 [Tsukamurella asaccharolytica]|uniref:Uncharacterized protein n=1 Tax=Tsukamurella asaccharolytica TaxID=2592067 RepID=A0A5C5R6B9_9ACTN|nr:hypothetical protein [Tsukamurella asaccharolytica]TWS18246.1 hypothetical protein FK529_16215 [Tsukamurella asaccharolytica]